MADSSDIGVDSAIQHQLGLPSSALLSMDTYKSQSDVYARSPMREFTLSEFIDLLITLEIPFIGTSKYLPSDPLFTGLLGKGGFGEVYYDEKAFIDINSHAVVAIKEF